MIASALLSNPPKSSKSNKKTSYTSKRIIMSRKSLPPATPIYLLTPDLKTSPWTPISSTSGFTWKIISGSHRTPAPISFLKNTTITPSRPAKPPTIIIKKNSASRLFYSRIYGRSCRNAVFKIYHYLLPPVISTDSTPPINFGDTDKISKNIITTLNPCIRSTLNIKLSALEIIIPNLSPLYGRS